MATFHPYAIQRADGGMTILQVLAGVDPAEEVAKWEGTADPSWLPIVEWRAIKREEIPQSRGHRNAWKIENGKIAIDPARAAQIDATPKIKTIEERLADLERARVSR